MLVEENENYSIDANKKVVRIASKKQFQFEPKDWLKELQKKASHYIRQIAPKEDSLLKVFMISDYKRPYDLENVLLYNLGMNTFKSFMQNGVDLSRIKDDKYPLGFFAVYSLTEFDKLSKIKGDKIAVFSDIKIGLEEKVSNIWYQFKSNLKSKASFYSKEYKKAPLGLELTIRGDVKLEKLLKPLIDAIISAFCKSSIDEESLSIISNQTGFSKSDVKTLIEDTSTSPLGFRDKLVHKWKDTIQWNPPDDMLDAIRVKIEKTNDKNTVLEGKLVYWKF